MRPTHCMYLILCFAVQLAPALGLRYHIPAGLRSRLPGMHHMASASGPPRLAEDAPHGFG